MHDIHSLSIGRCEIRKAKQSVDINLRLFAPWFIRVGTLLTGILLLLPAILILAAEPLRGLPVVILNIGWWLYSFGRTLLWSLFGQETIAINHSSLSYQRSYGIIRTKRHTIAIPSEVKVEFVPDKRYLGSSFGHLLFYVYNNQGTRKLAFQTTMAVHRKPFFFIQYSILRFFRPHLFSTLHLS